MFDRTACLARQNGRKFAVVFVILVATYGINGVITSATDVATARNSSSETQNSTVSASVSSRKAHESAHRVMRGRLQRAISRNPRLIASPAFVRKAVHTELVVPGFVRLNRCTAAVDSTCTAFAPTDDFAELVITSLGIAGASVLPNVMVPTKTLPLQGGMQVDMKFKGDPQQGTAGEIEFTVTHISIVSPRQEILTVAAADLASCAVSNGLHELWLQTGHITSNPGATSTGTANFLTGRLDADLRTIVDSNNTIRCMEVDPLGGAGLEKFTWTSRTLNPLNLLRLSGKIVISPGLTLDQRARIAKLTASTPATNDQVLALCNNDAQTTGGHNPPTTFPPPQAFCTGDLSGVVNVSAPALSGEVIIGRPCEQSMFLANASETAGPPNDPQTRDCPARNPN